MNTHTESLATPASKDHEPSRIAAIKPSYPDPKQLMFVCPKTRVIQKTEITEHMLESSDAA